MEFVDFSLSASQIGNALGLISPQSQMHCIISLIKKSSQKWILSRLSETTTTTTTTTTQDHVEILNIQEEWKALEDDATQCQHQGDLEQIRSRAFDLLFANTTLKQRESTILLKLSHVGATRDLQVLRELNIDSENVWNILEKLRALQHADLLQDWVNLFHRSCKLFYSVNTTAARCYGRYGERNYITEMNRLYETPVIRKDYTTYSYDIPSDNYKFKWGIQGRIDGLDARTGCVIEIKHRKKNFMNRLPLYELIQVHAYMLLTKSQSCRLIQCIQTEQAIYSESSCIKFSNVFWDKVTTQISQLIRFIEQLVTCELAFDSFNSLPENKRTELIQRYITPLAPLDDDEYNAFVM